MTIIPNVTLANGVTMLILGYGVYQSSLEETETRPTPAFPIY
jgi:hypothetical protein